MIEKGWCSLTRVEDVCSKLIAFYPIYSDQGNVTRVIYQASGAADASISIDSRQVESVKRALARCYAIDLQAQAHLLRSKYHRRILLHFYLPDGRVFVPFKLRESRIIGDACYGYIDIDQVARLIPGNESHVMLKNGDRLPLAYFMGLEILADCVSPQEDSDLDLVNALAVLRKVFAGEPLPGRESSRHFRAKFLPRK